MINKEELTQFLLKARAKTYYSGRGKVESALKDSKQLEYREDDWFYRDIYYSGNGIFMGLETIYKDDKPVWAMSYYGNFKQMSEEEIDRILKKALLENWQNTRTWKHIEWEFEDYRYICEPDEAEDLEREEFIGSIEEMAGIEKIYKQGKDIYTFVYAGGLIKDF